MDEPIEEALAANLSEFMEQGPGLRYMTQTWIAAKDTVNGYVLLSGLGGMGIGSMWFEMREAVVHSDGSRSPATTEDPSYADAPDVLTESGSDGLLGFRNIPDPKQNRAAHARTAAGMMTRQWSGPTPEGPNIEEVDS